MNELDELKAYIENSPNHFSRYIEKSRPDIYNLIKGQPGKSNAEKAFNLLNPGVRDKHLTCKMCPTPTTEFISMTKGYRIYCSNKCQSNDPETKEAMLSGLRSEESKKKRKETLIKNYGTDSIISLHREKAINTRKERSKSDYWNNLILDEDLNSCDFDKKSIYVYAYLNPLKLITDETLADLSQFGFEGEKLVHEPFYVGYGTFKRIGAHLFEAKNSSGISHKVNTIRSIWAVGNKPTLIKLTNVSSKKEGLALEQRLIEAIGTVANVPGIKRGPLTNQTSGGEGGAMGEEVNKKLSKSREGKVWITNGSEQKFVPIEDLAVWACKGWARGVKPSKKRDEYFLKPHTTKSSFWVTDGTNNKRLHEELTIPEGWVRGQTSINPGQHKKQYMWITNGIESKNALRSDQIPEGWYLGRVRAKFPGGYK